ncbi:MAG: hypothetical protein GDA50_06000 [Alphaproteobacteria bacterium GM202ARS2]|nr:hypothetical protein [Alphaproteobacteria bacterium GM202ARS2]
MATVKMVMMTLMVWISHHSGYEVPTHMPRVFFIDQKQISEELCGGPCPVRAFYRRGEGIFLEKGFSREMGLCEVSILLHELVHVMQDVRQPPRYMSGEGIREWVHREEEAHRLQQMYLRQYTRRYRPEIVSYAYDLKKRNVRDRILVESGDLPRHFFAQGCLSKPSSKVKSRW